MLAAVKSVVLLNLYNSKMSRYASSERRNKRKDKKKEKKSHPYKTGGKRRTQTKVK